jgi:hypothetical protein
MAKYVAIDEDNDWVDEDASPSGKPTKFDSEAEATEIATAYALDYRVSVVVLQVVARVGADGLISR